MKSTGTAYWNSPNTDATNESGFSALPAGYRHGDGSFNIRDKANFWSATEYASQYVSQGVASFRYLDNSSGSVSRYSLDKLVGASVRCLRDWGITYCFLKIVSFNFTYKTWHHKFQTMS